MKNENSLPKNKDDLILKFEVDSVKLEVFGQFAIEVAPSSDENNLNASEEIKEFEVVYETIEDEIPF
ncbi:MAG: hypothetical protein ACTTJS_07045 [Wolinella sp.]